MKTKIYDAKSIIDGKAIGKPGAYYVAIPEKYKGFKIFVFFDGKAKEIGDWMQAEAYRRFPDKFGRGTYTLAYFLWKKMYGEQLKIDSI